MLALTDDLVLIYGSGSEYDPGDPFGACVLTVSADDTTRLDNRHRGAARSWTATLAGGVLARVIAHLNEAGFPAVPPHRIPPGATRTLVVRAGGTETAALPMGFHEGAKLPGYGPAFALLDSVVVAASGGALKVVPRPEEGVVAPGTARPA